ncbi:MAG: hypothetical protein J3K34DRAFT_145517 [Monoraphidium minutum]|nr:MAG: hypothetical protein J3K34DRAFT_145517 [Monoraphidium minutum]
MRAALAAPVPQRHWIHIRMAKLRADALAAPTGRSKPACVLVLPKYYCVPFASRRGPIHLYRCGMQVPRFCALVEPRRIGPPRGGGVARADRTPLEIPNRRPLYHTPTLFLTAAVLLAAGVRNPHLAVRGASAAGLFTPRCLARKQKRWLVLRLQWFAQLGASVPDVRALGVRALGAGSGAHAQGWSRCNALGLLGGSARGHGGPIRQPRGWPGVCGCQHTHVRPVAPAVGAVPLPGRAATAHAQAAH